MKLESTISLTILPKSLRNNLFKKKTIFMYNYIELTLFFIPIYNFTFLNLFWYPNLKTKAYLSAYCVFYSPEYQSVFPVDKPLGFNSSSDMSHCICQTTTQSSITRVELEVYIFMNEV